MRFGEDIVPLRLYELVLDEVGTLQKIMEHTGAEPYNVEDAAVRLEEGKKGVVLDKRL